MAVKVLLCAILMVSATSAYEKTDEPQDLESQSEESLYFSINGKELDVSAERFVMEKDVTYNFTCKSKAESLPLDLLNLDGPEDRSLILYLDGAIAAVGAPSAGIVSFELIPSNYKQERVQVKCSTMFEEKTRTLEMVFEFEPKTKDGSEDTNPDEPDTQAMITVLVVCGGLVAVVLLVSVTVVIMCHCSAPAKRSRKYAKLNETA